jgi:riboflavin kinase, archaea type
MAVYTGRVVSGLRSFSYWIEKLSDHYTRKTGMLLFPGTLNVELEEPYDLPRNVIRLEGEEYGSHVSVSIVPCNFQGLPAFILRTDANDNGRGDHPRTIVEIATNVKLRDRFDLRDGDMVTFEVDDPR